MKGSILSDKDEEMIKHIIDEDVNPNLQCSDPNKKQLLF